MPLADVELDENRLFENMDFSNVLDDKEATDRAFKQIDYFNDKYRISKYVLDQDLAARIMFEKGFSVGIDGLDLSGLVSTTNPTPIRIAKNTISRLPGTDQELFRELINEGMMEFDSQVRFLQSVLKNKQWHNVKLTDADVHKYKKIFIEYLTNIKGKI